MFPDWWCNLGFILLALAVIIGIAGLWRSYRKSVRDCTDHGELWPNEPCGRSLAQCPYNKSEHIDYFNAHGDKPHPFTFR